MNLSILYSIIGILIVGNLHLLYFVRNFDNLQFISFDVGQGQSVFVRYNDITLLIDTGEEDSLVDALGRVSPAFDKEIDYLIITHPHADHFGNFFLLQKRFNIKNIIVSRLAVRYAEYRTLIEYAEEHKLLLGIQSSAEITMDNLTIKFFQLPSPYSNINNSSLVTHIQFGEHTFLVTGDLQKDRETELQSYTENQHYSYYVAGHHGSATSSGEKFIETISPKTAIISVGFDNTYGLPSEETITRFVNHGITVFRTDEKGDFSLICTLYNCDIQTP